jgi:sec-independent protein translocase protein TatB
VFGINGGELIVLLVVIAVVVGPERLPEYAAQLGRWARALKEFVKTAKTRVEDELGEENVDWEALDPRQYDPRRIVREALRDEPQPAPRNVPRRYTTTLAPAAAAAGAGAGPTAGPQDPAATTAAPFDDEAT